MKLKLAPLFFLIFFAFFLVLGMETGQGLFASQDGPKDISGADPFVEEGSDRDVSDAPFLLLIQVDDMQKDPPLLESVWLMGYGDQNAPLLFFPLLPSQAQDGQERDKALREAFHIKDGVQPSSAFFTLLADRNLDWSGYLVMDKSALAAVVRLIDSESMEGDLVPAWGPADVNREEVRVAQSDFILGICQGIAEMESTDALQSLFTDHLVLKGLSPAALRQIWGTFNSGGFRGCQFPTLAD